MAGLRTVKRGDSRFYVDPDTREKVPGVTSVLSMLPKEFLKFWSAKVTAEAAVENLGAIVTLALRDSKGAIDYLKRAPLRNTGDAADTGTEVHEMFETVARGGTVRRPHPELEPYLRWIHEFHERFQPEYLFVEDAVWSDKHKYAGSFDALCYITIDGVRDCVMLDAKTTRSGIHEEVGLQLAAYKNADYIVTQDGAKAEMPTITAGAALHLRPEGWRLVPARVDDEVFPFFLHLREIFRWEKEFKHTVIGEPLYDSIATTGAQRRA